MKMTQQEKQIQKQQELVSKLRKQYEQACEKLVKLIDPTSAEQSEAEDSVYQFFSDYDTGDHLDYNEMYAEMILTHREDAETLPDEYK